MSLNRSAGVVTRIIKVLVCLLICQTQLPIKGNKRSRKEDEEANGKIDITLIIKQK